MHQTACEYLYAVLIPGQHAVDELLEVLDAVLARDNEPALVKEAGTEAALDRLAEGDIFLEHLPAEIDHRLHVRAGDCRAKEGIAALDGAVFVDGEEGED